MWRMCWAWCLSGEYARLFYLVGAGEGDGGWGAVLMNALLVPCFGLIACLPAC